MPKIPKLLRGNEMRHALVKTSDSSVNRLDDNVDPSVQTKPGFVWLPCAQVAQPTFDPAIETVEGPTYVVGANSVTEVWSKRSLTAQEISDRKDSKISAIDALQFKISFDMENRVRAIEGKPVITAAQYRTALKAVL